MKHSYHRTIRSAVCLLAAFLLWTAAVMTLDVQPIGPQGSAVGLASLNAAVHRLTGVNMTLYLLTDWLGLIPIAAAAGFGCLGLVQWIRRGSIRKVDASLLILGGCYLLTIAAYLFFETVVINSRPVLIDGRLEASYPSSTTLLVLCVMPTASMQLRTRIGNARLRKWSAAAIDAFTVCMVIGRLLSGVHWISDIIGGMLLSGGLVLLYRFACSRIQQTR